MARHPMAPADGAWLRMDRPTNLMVVTSVMWFDGPLNTTALRALLTDRVLARFPRFRQRAVETGGLFWEDVEDFDLEDHLHPVDLPAPYGQPELEEFTSSLVSRPLPHDRPLWDLYLIDRYGAGSAVVFRMHHAIADGIALARLMLSLTDDPGADPVAVGAPVADHLAADAHHSGLDTVLDLTGAAAHAVADLATHPLRLVSLATPHHLGDLARSVVADTAAAAKLALMPADHPTALRGKAGVDKQVLWSSPIELDRLKRAGHDAGTTLNDLLLTAIAGALRTHLVRQRSPIADIRAIVPFNLRPMDQPLPAELGNKFGLVYVPLPLTVADREERLQEMARRTRAMKNSAEGLVAYGILELVGLAPAAVENLAIDIFASKGTGVMTNVPGPRHQVTLAGTPVLGTIGWGPTSGELGLGVALFSYNGSVTIGLAVDHGLIPDPRTMLQDMLDELDSLLLAHAVAR